MPLVMRDISQFLLGEKQGHHQDVQGARGEGGPSNKKMTFEQRSKESEGARQTGR